MSYNKVSIRDFQKYAGKYLNQLPITLTRFGVPIASVIQIKEENKSVIQKSVIQLEGEISEKNLTNQEILNKQEEEKQKRLEIARKALGELV